MGLDPISMVGIGLAGAGGLIGGIGQNNATQDAMRRTGRLDRKINNQLDLLSGAGSWEQLLTDRLGQFGQYGQLNYDPYTAAQVGIPDDVQSTNVTAAQAAAGAGYTPDQIDLMKVLQGIDLNTGQDGLLQMLNRGPADVNLAGNIEGLDTNLRDILGGNTQFDNSALFSALQAQDKTAQTDALTALRGSYGSLGQRFGSANMTNEAKLLTDLANNNATRNAQIASTSFENAQNRRLSAGSLLSGLEGSRNQRSLDVAGLNLQDLGLKQNAASLLAQLGQTGALARLSTAQQLALANQAANLQAGLQNQQLTTNVNLANANALNTIGLANQSSGLQAALANQAARQRAGEFNATALNSAGQFNAANSVQARQAAEGLKQGSLAQLLQAIQLGGGFAQNRQNSINQLLGIMAGVPTAGGNSGFLGALGGTAGDIGGLLALLPFLNRKDNDQ